jgi:hypothetical protein
MSLLTGNGSLLWEKIIKPHGKILHPEKANKIMTAKKTGLFVVGFICLLVIAVYSSKISFATSVGQYYPSPDSGWTRINDNSQDITFSITPSYEGDGNAYASDLSRLCKPNQYTSPTATYSFYGDGVRVIAACGPSEATLIQVSIDGNNVGSFSTYSSTVIYQILKYEYTSLSLGNHTIVFTVATDDYGAPNGGFCLDAIDVRNYSSTTPSPTPTTTAGPTPPPGTDLCRDYTIVGSVGSFNPGTLSNGSQVTQSFSVTGAELGDFVKVSFSQNLQGVLMFGYVSAANQVTVVFQNNTGNNVSLSSGTVRVHVNRHER